ncbi:hypothetical protein GCM10022225_84150 [Plantactinospora mayteni]|uniref:Transposase n=1 Tax=Plantactinospora mayteni TaxID=566021 RepID=A0ABQ4F4M6_9ACTN|nr:hypothetical protein [Plantactinospora mayteni]GIH01848.1 hypothetical protein Pma05_84200 [Plantactinospora mayteni]
MSPALAVVRPETAPGAADALWSAIDEDFLTLVGWDPQIRVLTFPPANPLLGIKVCVVAGCEQGRGRRNGLCPTCNERWAEAGSPDVEEFAAVPRIYGRTNDIGPCAVPGCQRPWTSSAANSAMPIGHSARPAACPTGPWRSSWPGWLRRFRPTPLVGEF